MRDLLSASGTEGIDPEVDHRIMWTTGKCHVVLRMPERECSFRDQHQCTQVCVRCLHTSFYAYLSLLSSWG